MSNPLDHIHPVDVTIAFLWDDTKTDFPQFAGAYCANTAAASEDGDSLYRPTFSRKGFEFREFTIPVAFDDHPTGQDPKTSLVMAFRVGNDSEPFLTCSHFDYDFTADPDDADRYRAAVDTLVLYQSESVVEVTVALDLNEIIQAFCPTRIGSTLTATSN